jgi:hypothetical protein
VVIIKAVIIFSVRHHHRSDPLSNLNPDIYQAPTAGDKLALPNK